MELSLFITTLITEGKVSVTGKMTAFEPGDIEVTKRVLAQYYSDDILELPGPAISYSEGAALWAAMYFYKAVQLTVLRDLGEETIKEHMIPYAGIISEEAVYSADLVLRYLPSLFELAKGLAPADLLVKELYNTAVKWPLSSVGIQLNDAVQDEVVLLSPSLRQLYIDRIIAAKDYKRIYNKEMENYLYEVTGNHLAVLCPGFEPLKK